MKIFGLISTTLLWGIASLALACTSPAGLEIEDHPDVDLDIHKMATHDIWAMWYHPEAYSEDEVKLIGDRLALARCTAIEKFNMQLPPSVKEGIYFNVILHDNEEDAELDDGFDDEDLENAVGEDDNGLAMMELSRDAVTSMALIDHEAFHVIQLASTTPFEQAEFGAWFIEASADWYAWTNDPDDLEVLEQLVVLFSTPYMPLWLSGNHMPDDLEEENWFVSKHHYAMNSFLAYLQLRTPMTPQIMTEGYFNGTELLPQEYYIEELGFRAFADAFADFAAKTTAMIVEGDEGQTLSDFIWSPAQREAALAYLESELEYLEEEFEEELGVFEPINIILDAEDLDAPWVSADPDFRPMGFGYNVIEIENPTGQPILEITNRIVPDLTLRLVTLEGEQWQIKAIAPGDTLDLEPADSAYVVVAYTPKTKLSGFRNAHYAVRLR